MKKSIVILIGICVVASLVLAWAVFVKPEPASPVPPPPPPPPVNGDTSDWKTYRNEEFGFEFKYPTEWRVEDDEIENTLSLYPSNRKKEYGYIGDVIITIYQNPEKFSLREYYTDKKQDYLFNSSEEQIDMKIGEIPAIKFLHFLGMESSTITSIAYNNIVIEITDMGEMHQDDGIYNQILSTFKFTNQ